MNRAMNGAMNSADIREAFLAFFEARQHTRVPSGSLVPHNDPTLLFTNAGMNQFKDVFLGRETRDYVRACSSQRCVRAGGKHNDLENVGYTARHHTFFEMLGNFSFGDYFKREAIEFAWEFLTGTLGLPEDRLWVTVHVSDDEAADLWLKHMGVSAERFSRLDEDNFWQMGDTGPCGPCSEIYYDHGPEIAGGPPGTETAELDRFVEIWNLVFVQYNRDGNGDMQPLPAPSVDTGMGLERVAAIMQGVHSNYDIDLFQTLLRAAAGLLGREARRVMEESAGHEAKSARDEATARDREKRDTVINSLRVIADHIRSCAFLVCDGVQPANEGRGYVLRRIVRRAVRHGNKLGARQPFFHKLVAPLADEMGDAYPELRASQGRIEKVLLQEEEQFAKTLDKGMDILDGVMSTLGVLHMTAGKRGEEGKLPFEKEGSGTQIPGEVVFKLYDTYGFPVDLTGDIAREHGLTLDEAGYEAAMAEQRRRSQESGSFDADYQDALDLAGATEFTGYKKLSDKGAVTALLGREGTQVESLTEGEEGAIVLDRTPFYGESGGQVGDTGHLEAKGEARGEAKGFKFEVRDTTVAGSHHLHHGVVLRGSVSTGQAVNARVDGAARRATARNHSATHLLHAALRRVLGDHVEQRGSLVDARRLRFDFSHPQAVAVDEIKAVERLVNEQVHGNSGVKSDVMDMASAQAAGALALFGEKYGDEVRVLTMGEKGFSVELCGGTHVARTGDIGLVRIASESGISAGVRRIEAVSGAAALAAVDEAEQRLGEICDLVRGDTGDVVEKVRNLRAAHRDQEKEIGRLKQKLASAAGGDLTSQAVAVNGTQVLAATVEGADAKSLRDTVDQLKSRLGSGVILLAAVDGDKVALTAGVTGDLTGQVPAGDLMREFAARLGGKGGGRPDMAQGGGSDVGALAETLRAVPGWVEARLQ